MQPRISSLLERLRGSGTGKAAGLAGAMIANNVIGLVVAVVFARLLTNYGALAALVSYLVILTVAGQALQVATAREGVLGHLGTGEELLATLERWARALGVFTVLATIASVLARHAIADAVGDPRHSWAAAAGIPAGCIYLGLCTLRGALQGIGDYRSLGLSLIGEQAGRLVAGGILAAAGLGIGGAYLGSLIAYVAMSVYCTSRVYKQLAGPTYQRWRLRSAATGALGYASHIWSAAVPITALAIVQVLQNIDLIIAKHQFSDKVASSYAVAAVAAKVLIWVAMGASFYLVPETSRLHSEGRETRPVLLKSLGIVLVCAAPCMLIYAFGAHPLLARRVQRKNKAIASSSACSRSAPHSTGPWQAHIWPFSTCSRSKRVWFLPAVGLVAAIEPILLLQAPKHPASFAAVVLLVQLIGAALAVRIGSWRGRPVLTRGGLRARSEGAQARSSLPGQARPSCSAPGLAGSAGSRRGAGSSGRRAQRLRLGLGLGLGGPRLRQTRRPERKDLRNPQEIRPRASRASRVWRAPPPGDRADTAARCAARSCAPPPARGSSRSPWSSTAQQLRREVAERADHGRLDQLELAVQILATGVQFVRIRIPVPRGPAFDRVADEDLAALDADLGQELLEQLARLAYERQPLEVLVGTRRLRRRTSGPHRRRCPNQRRHWCGCIMQTDRRRSPAPPGTRPSGDLCAHLPSSRRRC